jgi:hypothetical protein
VQEKLNEKSIISSRNRFDEFKSSEDYSVIINFLYGNEASETLGFNNLGVD